MRALSGAPLAPPGQDRAVDTRANDPHGASVLVVRRRHQVARPPQRVTRVRSRSSNRAASATLSVGSPPRAFSDLQLGLWAVPTVAITPDVGPPMRTSLVEEPIVFEPLEYIGVCAIAAAQERVELCGGGRYPSLFHRSRILDMVSLRGGPHNSDVNGHPEVALAHIPCSDWVL